MIGWKILSSLHSDCVCYSRFLAKSSQHLRSTREYALYLGGGGEGHPCRPLDHRHTDGALFWGHMWWTECIRKGIQYSSKFIQGHMHNMYDDCTNAMTFRTLGCAHKMHHKSLWGYIHVGVGYTMGYIGSPVSIIRLIPKLCKILLWKIGNLLCMSVIIIVSDNRDLYTLEAGSNYSACVQQLYNSNSTCTCTYMSMYVHKAEQPSQL